MLIRKVVNLGKIKELKLTVAMIDVQSKGCVGHVQFQDIEHVSVPEEKEGKDIGIRMKQLFFIGKGKTTYR